MSGQLAIHITKCSYTQEPVLLDYNFDLNWGKVCSVDIQFHTQKMIVFDGPPPPPPPTTTTSSSSRWANIILIELWKETSVTRFGKMWPLWRNLKNLLPFMEWQHFEPLLSNYLCLWANANCCKWPYIEHIINPSGHTERDWHWRYVEASVLVDAFSIEARICILNNLII